MEGEDKGDVGDLSAAGASDRGGQSIGQTMAFPPATVELQPTRRGELARPPQGPGLTPDPPIWSLRTRTGTGLVLNKKR